MPHGGMSKHVGVLRGSFVRGLHVLHERCTLAGMKPSPTPGRMSAHDERRAAVEASVDPRTIRAYLDPERRARMASTTRARIEEALRTLKLTEAPPVRQGTAGT